MVWIAVLALAVVAGVFFVLAWIGFALELIARLSEPGSEFDGEDPWPIAPAGREARP